MEERNKLGKFGIMVSIAGAAGMILSVGTYFFAEVTTPLYVLSLPIQLVAKLLAGMSLSSSIGNVAAWILYIMICLCPLAPVGLRCCKEKKVIVKGEDCVLALLSGYLFFLLYCFINPGVIQQIFLSAKGPEMDLTEILPILKIQLACGVYPLIIGYVICRLLKSFDGGKDVWRLTENLLKGSTILYTVIVSCSLPMEILRKAMGNGTEVQSIAMYGEYILKLLPLIYFVGIMDAAVRLIRVLRTEKFGGDAAKAAKLLADRSRNTVIVSVVCNIVQNLIPVVFVGGLANSNFLIDIPVLPLVLAFSGIIITEYLKESTNIYNENNMII